MLSINNTLNAKLILDIYYVYNVISHILRFSKFISSISYIIILYRINQSNVIVQSQINYNNTILFNNFHFTNAIIVWYFNILTQTL